MPVRRARLCGTCVQASMSAEEREKAEKEFLKVAESYEILSNDELRAKYDRCAA